MSARPTPYLDDLNPAQREAVEKLDGSVLMLAGAGTGKTKALTARMVHLMHTGRARPNEILSVTFTNKAAREMKTRMGRMMGQAVEGMPWLGTFHSICVKLLRRHAELISLPDGETASIKRSSSENGVLDAFETGPVPNPHLDKAIETHRPKGLHLKSNFTILDTDDQLRLLKQLIKAEGIDDKRWPARMLANIIDGWKNRALTPDTVPSADANAYNGRGVGLYAQYQRRLLELNAVDFGDLLLHMVTIFQTHPDILGQYQRWFRYILVDEYQDTNVAQYLWLRLLAQGHKNICCVGDDDQSIYGWRGAEVGNILRFEKDVPGAHVVRLEQNYRSTPHILGAASGVIRGNANRLGKELWTAAQEGEKVRLIGQWDGEEEARWIGDEIEAMQQGSRGMAPQDLDKIAILVRASHQMRAFEDRFLTIGLPYRVIGGPRFYERMEIRDAMAYFRLVTSPSDDLAFERIVNTPKRGLGDKAQQTIQRFARDNAVSLLDGAALAVEQGAIKGKGGKALGEFTGQLRLWGDLSQNVGNQSVIDRYVGDIFELETQVSEELCKLPELQAAYELLEVEYRGISISSLDFKHPLLVAMRAVDECELRVEQMRSQIGVFQGYIRVLNGDHVFFAEMILDESGYTEMWQNDKTPEAPGRLENLKELVKAL
jgi:DNA helicase-2/ATP-dependent DNA helicase PcrA